MKTDLYVKTILTVIAVALIAICFENFFNPRGARAQAGPINVVVSDIDLTALVKLATVGGPIHVTLIGGTKYSNLQVDENNPLPVKAKYKVDPIVKTIFCPQ